MKIKFALLLIFLSFVFSSIAQKNPSNLEVRTRIGLKDPLAFIKADAWLLTKKKEKNNQTFTGNFKSTINLKPFKKLK